MPKILAENTDTTETSSGVFQKKTEKTRENKDKPLSAG